MNKYTRRLTAILICLALIVLVCGCGSQPTQKPAESKPAETKPGETKPAPATPATKTIRAGSGPTGSVNHIVLSGIGSLLEKNFTGYKVSVEISSGSQENIRLLQQGTADIGIATVDAAYNAYEGSREFKDSPPKKIAFVMGGIPTVMHFMVRDNSPIKSIADLKGKKVGAGRGVMQQYYLPAVLQAYGLKEEDMKIQALQLADMTAALAAGNLDMICHCTPYPSTPIADLATTTPTRFLAIDEAAAKKVVTQHPYFFSYDIKAGTYKGQTKAVTALATVNTIVSKADASEELIYNWVKTILEHQAELKAIHPQAGEFNKDNALKMAIIPVHPGAQKYYKEAGVGK